MTRKTALLRNIPLFPRLIAVSAVLALGAMGIGGLGFWGIVDVNGNLRDIYELRVKSLSALYELQSAQKDITLGKRALSDAQVLANPAARQGEAERIESAAIVLEESGKLYDAQRKDAEEQRLWSDVRASIAEWDRSQQSLFELISKRAKVQQAQGDNRALLARMGAQMDQQEEKTALLWKQSSNGLDRLISLNVSGVGALYLRSQKTASAMLRTQVVMAAIIVGLALALSLVVARSISKPLQELTRITRDIVQTGNLDQTVKAEGRDELGVLARTFQEMVEKLRVIPAASREVSEAVKDLTELILDQTASVQQQASGLAQVTATMQELRQTSSVAAGKADTVIAVAKKADEFSGEGRGAAENSLRGLGELQTRIDQMMSKIADLSERMLMVSGITDTVKDLADQSNMLALNASIEAVRAGEMGKGFGVVAHEIRSLADQSVEATNRIRLVLGEIQGAIRSTVAMADQGKKDMDRSMEQIRSSGASLTEIGMVITETGQAARQIAASVSQQNVGITQIAGAIDALNQAMERTTSGISRAKDAAAKLSSLSDRVSASLAPTASH